MTWRQALFRGIVVVVVAALVFLGSNFFHGFEGVFFWNDADDAAGDAQEDDPLAAQSTTEIASASAVESALELLPRGDGACFSLCRKRVCRDSATGRLRSQDGFVEEELLPGGGRVLRCGSRKQFRVPDYFTIGYSQSGSTFFFSLLASHPQVDKACKKEINFFDHRLFAIGNKYAESHNASLSDKGNGNFGKSHKLAHLDLYLQCFGASREEGNLVGDNTIKTIYSDPGLPLWVRALNPEIKLLVLLRDPIDRVYSRYSQKGAGLGCEEHMPSGLCKGHFIAYVHHQIAYARKNCPELIPLIEGKIDLDSKTTPSALSSRNQSNNTSTSTIESMDSFPDPLAVYKCGEAWNHAKIDMDTLISSLYGPHVAHWAKFFPMRQFKFIQSERLFKDPGSTMQQVAHFLGIDEKFLGFAEKAKVANHNTHLRRASHPIPLDVRNELQDFFRVSNAQLDSLAAEPLSRDWL